MADSSNTAAVSVGSGTSKPAYSLVVVHPFGDYERGDPITDASAVADVLAGENAKYVTKVAVS